MKHNVVISGAGHYSREADGRKSCKSEGEDYTYDSLLSRYMGQEGQELLENGVRLLTPMCERMTSQRQLIYVQYADRRRGSEVDWTHPSCPLVS